MGEETRYDIVMRLQVALSATADSLEDAWEEALEVAHVALSGYEARVVKFEEVSIVEMAEGQQNIVK
jgi:hypothetical protein